MQTYSLILGVFTATYLTMCNCSSNQVPQHVINPHEQWAALYNELIQTKEALKSSVKYLGFEKCFAQLRPQSHIANSCDCMISCLDLFFIIIEIIEIMYTSGALTRPKVGPPCHIMEVYLNL